MTDVRPDGVHREQSTHYHCIALRSFLGARENARRFGLALPDGYDEHIARACEFAMHSHRPDGAIPALGDSDTGSYADLLLLAADLLEREDFRYAATAGREGTPPQRRCRASRTAATTCSAAAGATAGAPFADERFLMFDCGPLGDGGHGHYDLLNVEIAANGRPLVMDPGRFTYDEQEPNLRHWFKGTAAHNTVVVDGLDQTPYRRGKPRKGTIARGRLVARHGAPCLDLVEGEATSTCYDAVHRRRVAFVADDYWVVEDRLAAPTPHRYDLRFHLAPEADGHVEVTAREDGFVVRAPGMALVVAGGVEPRVEAGWIAPDYGIRHEAPVVSIVADGRRATRRSRRSSSRWPTARSRPCCAWPRTASATTLEIAGARRHGHDLLVGRRHAARPRPAEVPRGRRPHPPRCRGSGARARRGRRRRARCGPAGTATAHERRAGGRAVRAAIPTTVALAPDPAVPARDVLLDTAEMAERLGVLMGATGRSRSPATTRAREVPRRRQPARRPRARCRRRAADRREPNVRRGRSARAGLRARA